MLLTTATIVSACGGATEDTYPGAMSLAPQGSGGLPSLDAPASGGAVEAGSGGTTESPSPSAGGAVSGGAGKTSAGGTTFSNGGAFATGSVGPAPTADPPGTVTIAMDSFQLAPGEETYKCQNFDNPFGGQDAAVQRIVSDMSPGSHHMHLYNLTEGSGRNIEDCDMSDFHALVHASGRPHSETIYPQGMATRINGSTGLRVQVHYLNTTTETRQVNASIKLSPVDVTTVDKWVAQLYFNRLGLSVPPGAAQSVSTTCRVPDTYGAIGLILGGSHMHMRGVHFVAETSSGVQIAETDEWDEPPLITYDPPVILSPGDAITWTCTYNNETPSPIVFGESASKNEMCIYLARYYSSSPDSTQLECQAFSGSGNTARPNPR